MDFSGHMSVDDITPDYIKKHYLFGLRLVDDQGNDYDPKFYEEKIMQAADEVERACNIRIQPTPVLDEKHDYYADEYRLFAWMKLYNAPCISVERVKILYPTSVAGIDFPLEWVKLDQCAGQLQLVPTGGTISQVLIGQGGSFLPLITSGLTYLPQLFHIDYTCGFRDGELPRSIVEAICKKTVIELLTVVADVIYPPGLTSKSISIDGLGESYSIMNNGQKAPVFTGRITQYTTDLYGDGRSQPGLLQEIKTFYHGLNMAGVH